jgi:hypothetical protein
LKNTAGDIANKVRELFERDTDTNIRVYFVKADNVINDFSALLLAIFINFGMSFLVASFITFLILERESKVGIAV